jgi:hypothetical protein
LYTALANTGQALGFGWDAYQYIWAKGQPHAPAGLGIVVAVRHGACIGLAAQWAQKGIDGGCLLCHAASVAQTARAGKKKAHRL